jgi:DNA-directed RNA polymerase subunit M/transcription elongation factor TFIIS
MSLSTETRDDTIKKLSKYVDKNVSKEIEKSIYKFSNDYAEENDTPYLLDSIYENKLIEIISYLSATDSYVIKALKDKYLKAEILAQYKPNELNPEKYESIIKKMELEEYRNNNISGTNVFTCSKCKKSRCQVTQKQTRSGDEPPTIFVTCLECGFCFTYN